MNKVNYYWNEETIDHFTIIANYAKPSEVKQEIEEYVENCCQLEDGETEEDLVNDLYNQVFNQYDKVSLI